MTEKQTLSESIRKIIAERYSQHLREMQNLESSNSLENIPVNQINYSSENDIPNQFGEDQYLGRRDKKGVKPVNEEARTSKSFFKFGGLKDQITASRANKNSNKADDSEMVVDVVKADDVGMISEENDGDLDRSNERNVIDLNDIYNINFFSNKDVKPVNEGAGTSESFFKFGGSILEKNGSPQKTVNSAIVEKADSCVYLSSDGLQQWLVSPQDNKISRDNIVNNIAQAPIALPHKGQERLKETKRKSSPPSKLTLKNDVIDSAFNHSNPAKKNKSDNSSKAGVKTRSYFVSYKEINKLYKDVFDKIMTSQPKIYRDYL